MFEFIKSLFKKTPTTEESKCPFLVHADISESIVIKEVALEDVKPKTRKPKVTKLKEVKPAKPKVVKNTNTPTKADALSNIIQLVPPAAKKKGRPKKDKNV